MRSLTVVEYGLAAVVLAAPLAGCAGGAPSASPATAALQSQAALRTAEARDAVGAPARSVLPPSLTWRRDPDRSPGFAQPDAAKTAAVIVSDISSGDVTAYSAAGKPVASIHGLKEPEGLAVDASGHLFIADSRASTVVEYDSDFKTIVATLQYPNQLPSSVAWDPSTGTIGVTSLGGAGAGGPGGVAFYAPGATTPCATVGVLPPLYGTGLNWGTFDKAGNYYVDTNYSNGPAEIFGVVRGGCKAKTIEFLQIGNAINSIGGITVLADGDIAIVDTFGPAIYIYKSPVNGSLGLPIRTVWLRGAADPLSFALTKHQSELFTADYGFAESQGYDFPAGGRPTTVIETPSEPVGVAVPL